MAELHGTRTRQALAEGAPSNRALFRSAGTAPTVKRSKAKRRSWEVSDDSKPTLIAKPRHKVCAFLAAAAPSRSRYLNQQPNETLPCQFTGEARQTATKPISDRRHQRWARAPRSRYKNPQLPPSSSFLLHISYRSVLPFLARPSLHHLFIMDSKIEMPEQLLPCNDLDPVGSEGCDRHNTEIPSTPGVSLPLGENLADTMRADTLQEPAGSDSLADLDILGLKPATVNPQDLETVTQPTDGCPVMSAPEEPTTLAIFEGAEDQLRRSDSMTGGSNTKDAEPPAQPVESPAEPNPGHPATTHQAPGPTPGEHPEALTPSATTQGVGTPAEARVEAQTPRPAHDECPSTLDGPSEAPLAGATTWEADTSVKAQAETQSSDPSHDGCLAEPKTRKALEEVGDQPKVEHQPSGTAPRAVSGQLSRHGRAKERLAGSAEGVKLSTTTRMMLMRSKTVPSRSTICRLMLQSGQSENGAWRTA